MPTKKINICIDGFSACGKSTLAKSLAILLGYIYIDSGAMYRAVCLYFIEHDIDISSPQEIQNGLTQIKIQFRKVGGIQCTFLNGKNVETEIRSMTVSNLVSEIARISEIRQFLVSQQRLFGIKKGVVMDGRDIGTVVFPEARLKIFLHADENVRVQRRQLQLSKKGIQVKEEEIRQNLAKRDYIDSTRKDSPLKSAPDAVKFDNSNLSIDEQLDMIYALSLRRTK